MQDGNTWVYGDDGEETPTWCPACGATEVVFLGNLGSKTWLKCRCCGVQFFDEEDY